MVVEKQVFEEQCAQRCLVPLGVPLPEVKLEIRDPSRMLLLGGQRSWSERACTTTQHFLGSERDTLPDPKGGARAGTTGEQTCVSKTKSSIVLDVPNPAARIRSWAPEASRAATSRSRTAARYSWWVQPASRA